MVTNPSQPVQHIEVSSLNFDPSNPRLPSSLDEATEEEILRWMCADGGILDLMRSIGEQGYFDGEPLLVTKSNESGYVVVEGNRRLAALKLLQNPTLIDYRQKTMLRIVDEANTTPTNVPCMVYKDKDDVLEYLGYRHVTGIKSWSPLAKARYLQELSVSKRFADVDDDLKYRQLARVIGSRVDYVKRILAGLKLYDDIEENGFYGIKDLDEDTISFSLVTTALGHPGIVDFLGLDSSQDLEQHNLDQKNLEDLTRWTFERLDGRTRLGESRHFRDLNKVVAKEIALKEFRENHRTLQEALLYTDQPAENLRKLLQTAKRSLQDGLEQVYLVRGGLDENHSELLKDIEFLTEDISAILSKRLRRARESQGKSANG